MNCRRFMQPFCGADGLVRKLAAWSPPVLRGRVRNVPGVRELTRRYIEVIPDHSFKPHPVRLRPVEHAGVGNLELPERHLITVSSPEVGLGKRRGRSPQPPPEEALHRTWTEAITDFCNAAASWHVQLPFGPLVAIQPDPDRVRRIGVGLPERPARKRMSRLESRLMQTLSSRRYEAPSLLLVQEAEKNRPLAAEAGGFACVAAKSGSGWPQIASRHHRIFRRPIRQRDRFAAAAEIVRQET
jgi:hypothetical protein